MATATLNTSEEAQLRQTIEMFEVIVQSQPNDCQSLEILKEAYTKLGREEDVVSTSKRIAQAYMQVGQLSSAILEYETVLQRRPNDAGVQAALKQILDKANMQVGQLSSAILEDETVLQRRSNDTDVQAALKQIQDKANNVAVQQITGMEPAAPMSSPDAMGLKKETRAQVATEVDDGRKVMRKVFVEDRIINAGDFDLCWRSPDLMVSPPNVIEPFIHTLSDRGILPTEKSLKLLSDKTRLAFLPLDKYEVDTELARSFPMAVCRRWCVLPFDRMSKAILVATANPFNQQAAKELAGVTPNRLLWYLASPLELMKSIHGAFR